MRLEISSFAPGVSPDAALAWWFDFRDGDTDHAFLGARARRTILARSADVVEMEDRAPLFRERARAERRQGVVAFTGSNGLSRFRGEYRFEAQDGGTRVTLVADLDLRGVLKLGLLLARPTARALLRRDLDGHVKDLVREHG